MKKVFGTIFMALGILLVCGALFLFLHNEQENTEAGESVDIILPQIEEYVEIEQVKEKQPKAVYNYDMTEVMIDGNPYIGYLSIPSLSLKLPVMADWDYDKLKIAPCRYVGSTKSDDLVICAHNYDRHFGQLKNLLAGNTVLFTNMDGEVSTYEVVVVEILQPTNIEDMVSGDYDLSLFTCTYGGQTRVTVRADRVKR